MEGKPLKPINKQGCETYWFDVDDELLSRQVQHVFMRLLQKNTFLTDSKNKPLNNILLCFGVLIFGHSEQHHFKPLACLHVMT